MMKTQVRTIVTFKNMEPGISTLIQLYEQKRKEATHIHESLDYNICVNLMESFMETKQKDQVKNIKDTYPLDGFVCGTCGHEGELILIAGEDWITRVIPRAVSVKSMVDVFLKAFGEEIKILYINM